VSKLRGPKTGAGKSRSQLLDALVDCGAGYPEYPAGLGWRVLHQQQCQAPVAVADGHEQALNIGSEFVLSDVRMDAMIRVEIERL
jgi:hypothetical protein